MKRKLLFVLPVIFVLIAVSVIFVVKHSPDNKESTTALGGTAASSQSSTGTSAENTVGTIHLTPDTVSCVVYAPKNSEVMLDGQSIPYDENVNCYRIFTEATGKHTVTVSKYGCSTVTREVDFSQQKSAEIHVDLNITEEYKTEVKKAAYDNLLKLIEICADESGDLSGLDFYCEEDKAKVQSVVDGVIGDLAVDEGDYSTGKINIAGLVFDEISSDDTLSPTNDVDGTVVKFTLDYNYTWEYNGENYQDSGVDSEIQHPFIKMDFIDGRWYIRDVYLYMRKNVH